MNNMPPNLRKELSKDPYYLRCAREGKDCSGRVTWEHAWIYGGKQIQEKWAIIPLCWFHHLGAGMVKWINQLLSLIRATPEDLAKYPKKDWKQELLNLMHKYRDRNNY